MDLFTYEEKKTGRLLADRMRPTSLEQYIGQGRLVGILQPMAEAAGGAGTLHAQGRQALPRGEGRRIAQGQVSADEIPLGTGV